MSDSRGGVAGKVGAAIAISRVLGLVRECVLAKYFGAGFATDAFSVAFRIPNLLRDLFAEGALSAAFLPAFTRRLKLDGKESAWLLTNRLINTLLIFLGGATLAFFFGAKLMVYLQAAGFAAIPGKLELTTLMTRILSPFLLFISLAAVFMGLLNACGVFFLPALASSVFNISCILAGIFLSPFMPRWGLEPIVAMAVGSLAGGLGQFAVMLPSARAHGFRWRWTLDFSDPDLRRVGRLMLPAVLGLSATQINIIVDNQLASMYGDGPVSWLGYAFRITQLPIGVFGIAIATVAAVDTSRYAAVSDFSALERTLGSALRLSACLTFPATVGLVIFRHEIVRLLFQRDQFTPADTAATAQVLLYYAFALFAYSAVKIMVPAFYALDDSRAPVRISVTTVVFKIALNLVLLKPLGFLGIAASTAAASWLNYVLLRRRFGRVSSGCDGVSKGGEDISVYLRIALASTIMGFLSRVVFVASGYIIAGSGATTLGVRLCLAIMAGVASIVPLLELFRVPQAVEMRRMAVNFIRKFR
ncbi:MAG: murein biosynthesis integral membrane protein MurJ [Acidobacteria bacterium]|nr:murein biosynthesis integral membrane protein MurJ [Acidobacteriota bacterium]